MSHATKYLNLGCGSRYHSDWINIDIAPQGPEVIQHDLSRGIPLPDASCDVVYHAAMLEHLRRTDALGLLGECYRVLRPGGIIRVGVPDLEATCRLYLQKLEAALRGEVPAAFDYDWIMLDMFDQTVREQSGGEMGRYLRQNPLPNEAFVYGRIGEEGRQLVGTLRIQGSHTMHSAQDLPTRLPGLHSLRRRIRALPGAVRRRLLWLLLGAGYSRALEIGRFRLSGEVHQWMYDRYSLSRLLCAAGYVDPVQHNATSSQIPDWTSFHLDTLPDGTVVKPDLLFMEATKPETQ